MTLCLTGCNTQDLPEYWLCQGHSQQDVRTASGGLIERYSGQEPLLLERYQDSVFEFSAPVMFGLFVVCSDGSGELVFRDKYCAQRSESQEYREGQLNLERGTLRYADRRLLPGKTVTTVADYQCQYLGHTYSFKDLEPDEAH